MLPPHECPQEQDLVDYVAGILEEAAVPPIEEHLLVCQAMDAFCLLSVPEGFALVVLEAMLCQRPVIATPVGSVVRRTTRPCLSHGAAV